MGASSTKGVRDGRRLSISVRGTVQPGAQLWGDLAAAPQYLCSDWWAGAKHTCCGTAQEDKRQQLALSNWKKKGSNWRDSDCPPHDESQATEQGTELFPALEVFKIQTKPWATLSDLPTDLAFSKRLDCRALKVPSNLNYPMIKSGKVHRRFSSFPQIIILFKMSQNVFYSFQLHAL